MKTAIIPASLVNAGPSHRMDAGYWVRVAERAKRLGVNISNTEAMSEVQLTYSALYPTGQKLGLGDLIERAQQNADEELAP